MKVRKGRPRRVSARRRGISRIEVVLCALAVFVLFCGVVGHALVSRDEARNVLCTHRLGEIGKALRGAADREPDSLLIRGNYNPIYDGCPDRWSWVSAVRETVPQDPKLLYCPASPVRGLEPLNDLLLEPGVDGRLAPEQRQNNETCGAIDALNPSNPEAFEQRVKLVSRLAYRGYNSNYAVSWSAGRVQPQVEETSDGPVTVEGSVPWRLGQTIGPLSLTQVDALDIPSNNLPLLSEAAASGESLQQDLTATMKAGLPLGESMTAGPAFWHSGELMISPATDARPLDEFVPSHFPTVGEVLEAETADIKFAAQPGVPLFLQDTRAWTAVHGETANMLMADGAVKRLEDLNGDRRFNPGFPVSPRGDETPEELALRVGYRDSMCEINAFDIFTGVVLFEAWTPLAEPLTKE